MTSPYSSLAAYAPVALVASALISGAAIGQSLTAKPHTDEHPWLILSKRAHSLLQPLDLPPKPQEQSWHHTAGYKAGLYDSLLGYAEYLGRFGYDALAFRVLTDSMMAGKLGLAETDVPAFITAFFKVAKQVPSHNERLQNLIVWWTNPVFSPYQEAIKLRIYSLLRERQRLDLFPGKPIALISPKKGSNPPASIDSTDEPFARTSLRIKEQITADLLQKKSNLWSKQGLCQALSANTNANSSARACYSLALIASLKINRTKWIKRFTKARQDANGEVSPELALKVIHWLTYREQYSAALSQFTELRNSSLGQSSLGPSSLGPGSASGRLPLTVQQLGLFLLVKTGSYEGFDHQADELEQRLGAEAVAWRNALTNIASLNDLLQQHQSLFATALDGYSFDPLLPWHKRMVAYEQTANELDSFSRDLLKFSQWQRLAQRGFRGLARDADTMVASALLDDVSHKIVKGTLNELRLYQLKPADKARLLQASKLIIEQDSQFSRYDDAAALLALSKQQASAKRLTMAASWRRDWRGYLSWSSKAALSSPMAALLKGVPGDKSLAYLPKRTFADVQITAEALASQRGFERRGVLWRQILARQRSIAHHATRIQLILEPYRDKTKAMLDGNYYGQGQLWHRIGGVLTATYQQTKAAIAAERQSFDRRQRYVLDQTEAMTRWQTALSQQEGQLWRSFAAAKPRLLHAFDTMILRQRKLLAKWRTDRESGRYLALAGHNRSGSHDKAKLETLASSLKTLKMATWLNWPTITNP